MRKHIFSFLALLFVAQIVWAVDPSTSLTTYYASIDGKATNSNDDLRKQLCTIISTGYTSTTYSNLKDQMYAASSNPTDFYNGNNKTMEDIYSSKPYKSTDNGSSATTCGTGWNKEHTVPQSYFNEASPMVSDAHHVFPTDIRMNSTRSNYPYGENNAAKACDNYGYGHLGLSTFAGYTGTVFDPGDGGEKGSYKGDLARVYFYMVTRYRTTNFTQDNQHNGQISFTYSNGVADLTDYMKNLMLKWHREDPVSEKELIRNNAIYAHQHNRNPFVDYPCLVEYIWGEHKGESVDLSSLVSGYAGEGTDCCNGGGGGTSTTEYYTITWSVNGTPSSDQVAENTKPSAPSVENCSTTRVFQGWTTSETFTGKPNPLYASSEIPNATAEATYYAVFADVQGSGGVGATVTFESKKSDGSAEINSTIANSVSSSSGISSYSGSKVYEGTYGIKLGSGGSSGSVTCTLTSPVTTSTIIVDAKKYGSDTGTLSVNVNGNTTFGTAQSPSSDGGELTFTVNEAITVSSITVATSSKRAYVRTITAGGGASYDNYGLYCGAAPAVYTITWDAETNGGTCNTASSSVTDGQAVGTLPEASKEHATFDGWFTEATGGTQVTAETVPTSDVTYYAHFTDFTQYTVTWHSATAADNAVQYYAGDDLVMPTDPADCFDSRVFMGWTTSSTYTGDGSDLMTTASGTVNSNADYYAVYADKSTEIEYTSLYTRINSVDDIDNGDYLIVYENGNLAFDGGLEKLDAVGNSISVTITNHTIESTSETDAAVFTLTKSGENYTIRSARGFYIGQTSDANGLGTDASSSTYTNAISFDADSVNIVSSSAHLRYNATSGQTRFRYYKSATYSSQKPISLYKKVSSGSGSQTAYSNYSTNCGSKVTITFHKNDGSDLTTTQSIDVNKSTALTANTWVREHFTFAGWALSAKGEKVYEDGESVSLEEDIDLYALWIEDPQYTVTFYVNEVKVNEVKDYAGEELLIDDPKTCEDYTFVGWSTTECPTEVTEKPSIIVPSVIPEYDVSYYAIFSRQVAGGTTYTDMYQKITTAEELTTANYVVAAYYNNGYGAMSTNWKDTYYLAPTAVEPNNQDIITTSDGSIIWNITVAGNLVSFYNETAKYLYIEKSISDTKTFYNIKLGDNTEDNKFTHSVDDGNWLFTSVTYDDRVLEFYTVDSKTGERRDRWAIYKSADAPIYLYKQVVEDGHTTYYVSSADCLGDPTGVEDVLSEQTARKVLMNGKLYVLLGNQVYDFTGKRIQ